VDYSDNNRNNRNNSSPHCSVSNLLCSEQDKRLSRLAGCLVNSLSKQEACLELWELSRAEWDKQGWDSLRWAKLNSRLEDCLDNRLRNKQEGYLAQQARINLRDSGFWVNKLQPLLSANNLNNLLYSDKLLNNLLKEVYSDKLLCKEAYLAAKLLNLHSNSLELDSEGLEVKAK
jgi:hypothetical protein